MPMSLGIRVFCNQRNVSASMWATRNTTKDMFARELSAIVREVPQYYARLGKKGTTLSVALAEYMEGRKCVHRLFDGKNSKVYTHAGG